MKSLVQNVSGGLLGRSGGESLKKLRKGADNSQTALSYITKGIMLGDGSGSLDFTPFIQNVTLPNVQVGGSEDIQTILGSYTTSGYMIEPDSHEFNLEVVNTKLPILETVFYPWMRETTQPFWVYEEQPYTTATIKFDLTDHTDLTYVFYGCFPVYIQTFDPSQQLNSQFTRQVRIKFQYMNILSSLDAKSSLTKNLKKTLTNAVSNMI